MFKKFFLSLDLNSTRANFIWATILQIVEKGTGYIVLAILTRTIVKADLGSMFYALSISSLVAVALNFGTDTYLIRKVSIDPKNGLSHLSAILSIRIFAVIAGYVLLNLIIWRWMPSLAAVMLLASAHDFLEEIGYSFLAFFSGKKQIVYRLITMGGFKLATMILIAAIALIYKSLLPVLWGYTILSGLFVIGCFLLTTHQFGKFTLSWEPETSFSTLRTSTPFFLANSLTILHMRFDTVLIGIILNVKEVANYELGIKLVEVTRFLVRPLNIVFLPIFSEYFFKRQQKELRLYFWKMTLLMMGVGIFLAIFIYFCGPFVIYWLFGAGYSESVLPTQILFLSVPFLFAGIIANIVANAIHQESKTAFVLFVAVLVNIVLNVMIIPIFGIIGAAWVTVISQTILTLGMFLLVIPKLISSKDIN